MNESLKVLLVEDSENDAILLIRRLKKGGFDPQWERVQDADAMNRALIDKEWDLILSDYSMPNFNGLKALKIYKQANLDIPFILVSAMVGEDAAVQAMKEGAHDYLMKDKLDRLVPAIKRELREAKIRQERRQAAQEIIKLNESLEKRVIERTQQLKAANKELKAAQDELVRREKLAILDQLTATVSHELRNPLGVIRSSNFYLQRKFKNQDQKSEKHFRRIEEQVSICNIIIEDLLEYTSGSKASTARESLAAWLEQLLKQYVHLDGIDIKLNLSDSPIPILHDRVKMRRAMVNLLTNAIQAVNDRADTNKMDPDYQPEINIDLHVDDHNQVIVVSDNGIGMDHETCQKAFEPLFTTRARGIGIGLSNVKKIIDEHNGSITLESKLNQGTRITLTLPRYLKNLSKKNPHNPSLRP